MAEQAALCEGQHTTPHQPHQQRDPVVTSAHREPSPRQLSELVNISSTGAAQQLKQGGVLLAQDLQEGEVAGPEAGEREARI